MILKVETDARPKGVGIYVQFSSHCYTETHDPDRHGKDVHTVWDRQTLRAFCPERYALSKALPELIGKLPGSKVFQTYETNYLKLGERADGKAGEYRAYFNLKPANGIKDAELRLYVESAYAPTPAKIAAQPVYKLQKVRFTVLVDKTLKGEAVKFNPKR